MTDPKELSDLDCVEMLVNRTKIWTLKETFAFIGQLYEDGPGNFEEKIEVILGKLWEEIQELDEEMPPGWKLTD